MNHDTKHALVPAPATAHPMFSRQSGEPDPWRKIHGVLRGRYHIALILAVILSMMAAGMGYMSADVNYASEGVVQIKPVLQRILYRDEQNTLLPMFQQHVRSQIRVIQGPQVLEKALVSDEWKESGHAGDAGALARGVRVDIDRGTEQLNISFVDTDPKVAQHGARAIVDAFADVYNENEVDSLEQKIQVLENQTNQIKYDIAGLKDRITAVSGGLGEDELEHTYKMYLQEMTGYATKLKEVELMLNQTEAAERRVADKDAPVTPVLEHSPDQIARIDPVMRRLLAERDLIETDLDRLTTTYGPEHRQVKVTRVKFEALEQEIADQAQNWAGKPLPETRDAGGGALTATVLRDRYKFFKGLHDSVKKQVTDLSLRSVRSTNWHVSRKKNGRS